MTDTRMMTKRQGWALFCITKQDYRNAGLTYDEASKMIAEKGDPNYVKKPKVVKDNDAKRVMGLALIAGMEAMKACVPVPMTVVQHASVLDDKSPVVESWHVADGVCGFAWITFKANTTENRKFLAGLKAAGMIGDGGWGKATGAGYSYWVHEGGQSMQKKEAFAHAFAQVLHDNGITAYAMSRMD